MPDPVYKVALPLYDGKGGRTVAAQFISRFTSWYTVMGLDEAAAAQAFQHCLV